MSAIPAGYKQTEVGVIPEEWEVKAFGECLISRPRYGINASAVPFSDRLPTYIRITDITEDGRFSNEKPVSVDSSESSNYYLNDGDIVFARTGASVGKSYRYVPSDGPLVFAGFLIQVRPDKQKLLPAYAAAYVTTGGYWNWVRLMSMRSGQPGINGNEYSQLPIPVPPLPEQRAIAAALSDVDALLAKLDQFIAKKRDLKQAAMQQLLTGQIRLPGFSGEWEVKRLGDVLRFQVGFPFGSDFFNQEGEGVRLVKNRDLKSDDQIFYFSGKFDEIFLVKDGDVLIGMDGDFLPCLWSKGAALLNQRVGRVVTSPRISALFAYFMLTEPLKAIEYATSATTVKHLSHGDVEGIECALPAIEEQTAIATVLSDMDAELAALEARRDKTHSLKQGMMQELLTGRIRLV
jgi:type I restriction enzyme S subunit